MPAPTREAFANIRESVSLSGVTADRLDRVKGTIAGPIRVLGLESKNGVKYLPAATRKAVADRLYENAVVYVNHPTGASNARDIRDRFGRLREVYADDRGEVWAKSLAFNPSHSYADEFCWLVENDPVGIGLSHNIDGAGHREQGVRVIEEIVRVYSVDLVDGPGTVNGLFEQAQPTPIHEQSQMEPLTDPAAPPSTESAPDHKEHLVNAVAALAAGLKDGSVSMEDAKSQIQAILKLVDGGDKAAPSDDTGAEDAAGDTDAADDYADADEPKVMEAAKGSKLGRFFLRKLAANVREQRRNRVYLKVPFKGITEQFLGQVYAAKSDAEVDALIADRAKVTRGPAPKSVPAHVREQAVAADLTDPNGPADPAAPLPKDKLTKLVDQLLS